MPNSKIDVSKVMHQLHDKGVINLDSSIRDLLAPEGVGIVDPGSKLADYAVAWEHYVVVCGLQNKGAIHEINPAATHVAPHA